MCEPGYKYPDCEICMYHVYINIATDRRECSCQFKNHLFFQPVVQVNGEITVSRVVILTVHRQDRSVTSLLVPVYLGVYQECGVIHVQSSATNTVHRQDRFVIVLLVTVSMGVYREDWRITGTLAIPVILL